MVNFKVDRRDNYTQGDFVFSTDVSHDNYHSVKGIGSTALSHAKRSMMHFKAYYDGLLTPTSTQRARFDMGKNMHRYCMEKDQDIAIAPAVSKNTNAYKEFAAENDGKIIVDEQQMTVLELANREYDKAHDYEFGVFAEQSTKYVESTAFDVQEHFILKARPDLMYFHEPTKIIKMIDYKTVQVADVDAFTRSIVRYNYDLQAAHYIDIIKNCFTQYVADFEYYWLIQEVSAPCACQIIKAPSELLAHAHNRRQKLLNQLNVAFLTGEFLGPDMSVKEPSDAYWRMQTETLDDDF